jgi:hypothetical protein
MGGQRDDIIRLPIAMRPSTSWNGLVSRCGAERAAATEGRLIDKFKRKWLTVEVATLLPSPRVMAVLDRLGTISSAPQFICRDHGPRGYRAGGASFLGAVPEGDARHGPRQRFGKEGRERFNRTNPNASLHRHIFHSVGEGLARLAASPQHDHEEGPYGRLGNRTPAKFTREGLVGRRLLGTLMVFEGQLLGGC